MSERHAFDYAVIRIVPRVERGEFVNAGVIVFSSTQAFLDARIEFDQERVKALDATADIDLVRHHLECIPTVCAGGDDAGPIGRLTQRERFHWLVAPRSTVIQTSQVHAGVHEDPRVALDSLFEKLVQRPR